MHPKNANPVSPAAFRGIARGQLPRLDLLYSFEAAARSLSFTVAAAELFLTQSAVSRQIQQLESDLGVTLFERRHRALALTEAGRIMHRAVGDCLERLRDATASVRAPVALRQVAITTTPGFASLWLIPRLSGFTATHPGVDVRISATLEVLDMERSGIDVSVRLRAISGAVGSALFEETVTPVCSPLLLKNRALPLKRPADLVNHTLLAIDAPQGKPLTMDWEPWFRVMGLPDMRMKNTLRFSQYSDVVAAAVAGQGVAIGRLPLLAEMMREGRLVAPFSGAASHFGYFVTVAPRSEANADAQDFVRWLLAEAKSAAIVCA
jgi:LysR family glycine cleavage system transcriptional activator